MFGGAAVWASEKSASGAAAVAANTRLRVSRFGCIIFIEYTPNRASTFGVFGELQVIGHIVRRGLARQLASKPK